jgi:hypothetical protein
MGPQTASASGPRMVWQKGPEALPAPASAYAPGAPQQGSAGLMSGRGLY